MIIYVIASFFLENIFGLLFNNSYVIPLFFFIALLLYYQLKKPELYKYLLYVTLLGLIYDIVYSNIYINSLLLLVAGILSYLYYKYFKSNFLYILGFLLIYDFLYYIIYILLGLNEFNFLVLLKSLISIIPINIAYYYLSIVLLKKFRR